MSSSKVSTIVAYTKGDSRDFTEDYKVDIHGWRWRNDLQRWMLEVTAKYGQRKAQTRDNIHEQENTEEC